ncbi:four and a half LIM domains protein 3-like [Anguilla anguilla]|uniref:four and a half LIM domains protein 3-like n=1 Tax=Anguilla anguilla TaxID=7936 RepID=UPI0015ADB70C|nr:four and a half LIM domains protein 3-like [Anguilla anguilla]XP_035283799.1 four and a half LIM domains protein 3-like [Anguilla anguilla]XP_035283800.1 four and a half LIM domains protein 3-like [Anguilla anguilla]
MSERFDCAGCKESLYGRKFIQAEDGAPHCIPCYNKAFTHACAECKELIQHNARELCYDDRHYHEQCLRCSRCGRSLADERFTRHGTALLCNACFCSEFSSTCVACSKTIQPGSRKLEYQGRTWHEACFVCLGCQQPIGGKAFVPDEDGHYCGPCYENKFAPRCTRCKQVLVTGGVTYRDEAWHRHCFVCAGCGVELAGKQFTTEEDSPYCVQCFTNTYARKCEGCSEPVTGFGEGKFVSFEERHWHQTCFACSRCSASLLGVGFFPEDDLILCRDCSTLS